MAEIMRMGRGRAVALACVWGLVAAVTAQAAAGQDPADRFGAWLMRSDAPPPFRNVMTYEPFEGGGMRVTVEATNARGETTRWGYVTLFDGQFHEVHGQEASDTSVEFVDARTTRVTNRRNGRVTQVIINTLSEDGNTISNEYVRLDAEGKIVGVTHAVYERMR